VHSACVAVRVRLRTVLFDVSFLSELNAYAVLLASTVLKATTELPAPLALLSDCVYVSVVLTSSLI
jgi:hypothetical protein